MSYSKVLRTRLIERYIHTYIHTWIIERNTDNYRYIHTYIENREICR